MKHAVLIGLFVIIVLFSFCRSTKDQVSARQDHALPLGAARVRCTYGTY